MKHLSIKTVYFVLATMVCLLSCKKNDDNGGGNGGGGNGGGGNGGGGTGVFSISSSSPVYMYWGDELTINGSGFSTNKNDYTVRYGGDFPGCTIGAFEIISATATQVKLKTAAGALNNGKRCGPSSAPVILTLNGKSDTTVLIKFLGWPEIKSVCTHFGGWSGNYVIPGDSVALNISGAQGIWGTYNDSQKNLSLTVNGIVVPIQWRNYSACHFGLGGVITLEKAVFTERKCPSDPDWNGGGRDLMFKVFNPGTNRSDSMSIFVNWLPTQNFESYLGAPSVSMSAGGFPQWTIKGKNMTYIKARFTSTNCPGLTPQDVAIANSNTFYDQSTFPIPLSVLTVGCNYSVSIIDHCGSQRVLGGVMITP